MFKLWLKKAEEPETKLPTSVESSKKQESSRNTFTSALLTMPKPSRDGNTRPPDLLPEKSVCRSRSNSQNWHGTTDGFQIGKGICQVCILSPCLFNLYARYIMRNTGLDEAQAEIKIARRNINNLRYADDCTLMEKVKRTKEPLDESKRGEWKSWLKAQHSEN